jgi:hypothetical protein
MHHFHSIFGSWAWSSAYWGVFLQIELVGLAFVGLGM